MEPAQRELAMAVLASGLTDKSYEQAKRIIEHENVLGPLEKEQGITTFVRDTELYYFPVFGEPGGKAPLGLSGRRHHVSIHFSIWGDRVISMTPFFFGPTPPRCGRDRRTGCGSWGDREDLAFNLMASLDKEQIAESVIYDAAPADIVTFNASKASCRPTRACRHPR
ncbi:MAG: hypothetical protein CM1200mP27_03440 [Chloroflexota bacterium]|nr:MAG: hypothetical protein CM1200mP27_03440 [Chloroflexota bacterium]